MSQTLSESPDSGYVPEGEYAPEADETPTYTGMISPDQLRHGVNLAEYINEADLATLGTKVKRNIEIDDASRAEWLDNSKVALDLAMQVAEKKSYPIPDEKSSNVVYPMITVASIQFAQRCYPAVVPGAKVVTCKVVGDDSGVYEVPVGPDGSPMVPPSEQWSPPQPGQEAPAQPQGAPNGAQPPMPQPQPVVQAGAKAARAERVSEHMSWQCLNLMPEWESGIDQLLHYLPIAGCAFREVYLDERERRPGVSWYPADKFIINNKAKTIKSAPRFAIEEQYYPFEIQEQIMKGLWIETEVEGLNPDEDADNEDDQAPRKFWRAFCRLDLDDTGYAKPYIVTLHEDGQIVRIETNFRNANEDGTVDPIIDFVKYTFLPNPRGGFYDVGFGWLLSNLNHTVNSAINQLFDAGHWQNAPTGFVARGIRLGHGGDITLSPNKFKKVDSTGADLHKNIWMYQHPGPSATLFQLLGLVLEAGQSISSVQDIMQGRMDKNIAPVTAVTLVEQGMTTFTSIFKRVHRSLSEEFRILYRLNGETLPAHMYQYGDIMDDDKAISQEDYNQSDHDITPVTDPKMVSDQLKRAKSETLVNWAERGLIQRNPAVKNALESLQIADAETYLIPEGGPNPMEELALERMKLETVKTQQDMENERMDRVLKAQEAHNELIKLKADAIKALAEAEAAEAGDQLEKYRAFTDRLGVIANQLAPAQQMGRNQ